MQTDRHPSWADRTAHAWVRLCARLVPAGRRADWREAWEAELWHSRRELGRGGVWRVLAGVLPHAWWERRLRERGPSRRLRVISNVWSDVKYGVRILRRAPGFMGIAVLTIALGIGGNTAVFSVVNGVVLRPLPYPDAERVVNVGWDWGGDGNVMDAMSAFKFAYLREHGRAFEGVATWRSSDAMVGVEGASVARTVLRVSEDWFRVVGFHPRLGRAFTEAEAAPGGAPVVIVSESFWRNHLDADPGIAGRTLVLDGSPYDVVGVMPKAFDFPPLREGVDLIVPQRLRPDPGDMGANSPVMARLGPGVTKASARTEVRRVFDQMRAELPEQMDTEGQTAGLVDWRRAHLGDVATTLWILLAAVGLVLLIACANVANLLLARGTSRQREMAVRATLGAGRGRLAGQVLSESLVLSTIGGVVGLALGFAGLGVLLRVVPWDVPGLEDVTIDGRVVLFTLLVSMVTGLVFGLVAAFPAMRADLNGMLREDQRTGAGRRVGRLRDVLIGVEAALAMVLLAGAGLLIASFMRLQRTDLGFDPRDLVTVTFARAPDDYADGLRVMQFGRDVRERLLGIPGVSVVASASNLPLRRGMNIPMTVVGRPEASGGAIEWRRVSSDYFATMGMRIVRGRALTEEDFASRAPVIVINETLARSFWAESDAIGDQVEIGVLRGNRVMPESFDDPPREIVGIVSDILESGPATPAKRTMYTVPFPEFSDASSYVIRTTRPVTAEALMAAAAEVDPRMPAPTVDRLGARLGVVLALDRFNTLIMSLFASVALLLTAVGVYGVVAYTMRQRTAEIGIRVALGAGHAQVVRSAIVRGMVPVLAGIAAGAAIAIALTRVMSGMLSGIRGPDPLTFVVTGLLLVGVGLLASWIPSRRAAGVDPMIALRAD